MFYCAQIRAANKRHDACTCVIRCSSQRSRFDASSVAFLDGGRARVNFE
jgi:hypothetical protein